MSKSRCERSLRTFPEEARREVGYQRERVQEGVEPDDWKPMSIVGSGVREIRIRESSGAFRCIYLATGRREFMSCIVSKRNLPTGSLHKRWTWT